MNKSAAFACFNLAVAVSLGALAAHFLQVHLTSQSLASFQTGVRYHIIHSLALLVLSLYDKDTFKRVIWTMALGMIFFSISIYLLSTRGLMFPEDSIRFLGPVTPIGGVLLIASWLWAGALFLRKSAKN